MDKHALKREMIELKLLRVGSLWTDFGSKRGQVFGVEVGSSTDIVAVC